MRHLPKSQLAHKMTPCTNITVMTLGDSKVLKQDNGQNKKYSQNLHKFSHQKGLHIKSYSNS